ncbi:MAG TPA: GTP 3',8-cyclase MoaA [Clostridiaceae bacterium]|nr:GTP 3',8-cyclase MoaA [Clostridiaceae bacterium]
MQDGKGRKINYIRVSLTDRCNLRCVYCMPEGGIGKKEHHEIIRHEDVLKILRASAFLGINKVRFTGGEPLIVKDIDKLIYETSRIDGIDDIAITTNGILLNSMAGELKKAGLKRVNISLDSLKEDKFRKITRGGNIHDVFQAIEKCIDLGIRPVKINTVLIKGINDDEISDLMRLTKDYPMHVRFIELMPMGEGLGYYDEGFISSEQVLKQQKELVPLNSNMSSTASLFRLPNSKGTVGFISPLSCKFCSSCNRIRLTSTGTIKPCLHSDTEYDLKKYLESEIGLISELKEIIHNKPAEHNLENDGKSSSKREMFEIGG